ncbi:unnamed protein product [Closterium sp. Naga37s-1]|nr:unnamed protein product [Closterium sp. Naga37s-1]
MEGLVLAEGLEHAGEVTVERGALRDVAAAAGGAGGNDISGTELVAAAAPSLAAAMVPEAAPAAAASAAATAAGLVPAGVSAAAFGGGSTSPSAIPRVAQPGAEEPSPGADKEQTAEVVLSASPAPVTAAVLAAAMSAATGEQGGAPSAEDVMTAWPRTGRRQPPSERARRSSSAHTQEARGVSGLNEVAHGMTATHQADQPASNQDNGAGAHLPPSPAAPAAEGVATHRSARLGTVTWGPPRGGRTPWMPAGRAGLEATARSAPAAGRGLRGMGRGRRGGGRGSVAHQGGAEIQPRTGPWRERHNRPEVSEAAANGDEAGSAEENGDPDFMCGEEPGPESEEVSLDNEEEVGRGRNRARGTGEGADGETSHAVGGSVPAAAVANEVKSPATLAEDDAI